MDEQEQALKRRQQQIGILLVGGIAASCAFLAYLFYQSAIGTEADLPKPNGYDMIRQAALQIGERLEEPDLLSDYELEFYLEETAQELKLLRQGLKLPSVVPVQFDGQWIGSQMSALMGFRSLGHALAVETDLHQRRGETSKAIQSSMDLVQLGFAVSNRGLAIDFLVGSACELQALSLATNMLDQLDEAQCRFILSVLEKINKEREPTQNLFQRERRWAIASSGLINYFSSMFTDWTLRPEQHGLFETQKVIHERLRALEIMKIKIATRAYVNAKGCLPATTAELVPEFLQTIPVDPATSQPLGLQDTPKLDFP